MHPRVMRIVQPYKYLDEVHMIQAVFLAWHRDHLNVTCYLTPCNYVMVPAIVEIKYILYSYDIQSNFAIYNEKYG